MKPKRIFLVRHGESQGNADKSVYLHTPDFAVNLTDKGKEQARAAGVSLSHIIGNEQTIIYTSPFFRTRQTARLIADQLTCIPAPIQEDPRLREQEWSGRLRREANKQDEQDERDSYSHFYYRFKTGESCADVFDRLSDFFDTLHRDFKKDDFSENLILVTHGMTMRVFLMRWYHWTVERFEIVANPKNCEIWQMDKVWSINKYRYQMLNMPAEYPKPRCRFTYQAP